MEFDGHILLVIGCEHGKLLRVVRFGRACRIDQLYKIGVKPGISHYIASSCGNLDRILIIIVDLDE